MKQQIANVTIPDSRMARDATDLVRTCTDQLLYDHSRRVFLFGALQGRRLGLSPDNELLYVAAMFHDLGLTPRFHSAERRFEIDGAEQAREFLKAYCISDSQIRIVWNAIALHTTRGVPAYMEPEVALVTAGVELDVLGLGYAQLPASDREAILAAHPRPRFKTQIVQAFADGIAHKPLTAFGNVKADVLARCVPGYERTNFVDMIDTSPWAE